jgi:hypothetical protein
MVAAYRDNMCVFADGSIASVPPGETPYRIPSAYLDFHKGNSCRAQAAWEATQKWRVEKRVWRIHTLPNTWFSKIKKAYPHFVHGHSKAGFPIIYEQPGRMDLHRLFAEGCQVDDMLHCYTFFMEFISNIICARDEIRAKLGPDPPPHCISTWGIMVVMDVKGAGLSHLSGNVARYVKNAGDINSAHYPMSMKRAFVINAPFWLGGAWTGIKGILPDSVQVDILSERTFPQALREYIDDDQIPPEYGGTSLYSLGEHPYEVELRHLVDNVGRAREDGPVDTVDISTKRPEFVSINGSKTSYATTVPPTRPLSAWDSNGSTLALRRKMNSSDVKREDAVIDSPWKGHRQASIDTYHFAVAKFVFGSFFALQGALKVSIPFWILSPEDVGGLGFQSTRSCVIVFCSSFLLLCLARKKPFEIILRVTQQLPLRTFRASVGSEAILLAALSFASFKVPAPDRAESVIFTTASIAIMASLAAASELGCVAAPKLPVDCAGRTSFQPGWFPTLFESGRLSCTLPSVAEAAGMIATAPLLCWSFSSVPPFFLSATILLLSWFLLLLYASTFSHSLLARPETTTMVPADARGGRSCCLPLLGELVTASTGDVASLLEEGRWTPTLRGHVPGVRSSKPSNRARSFSDTSLFSDLATEQDSYEITGIHKAQ